MRKYVVDSSRILEHDQQRYEAGDVVELEDAVAAPLLELGAVRPVLEGTDDEGTDDEGTGDAPYQRRRGRVRQR